MRSTAAWDYLGGNRMSNVRAGTTSLQRYAPVLALAALVLALQTVSPSSSNTAAGGGTASGGVSAGGRSGGGSGGQVAGSQSAAVGSSGAAANTASGGIAAAASVTGSGGGTTSSASGPSAASTGVGGQQLDSLGRPLTGDTSHCAGPLQDNVTFTPAPCIPVLAGPNGGPTYQGVTANTINYVIVYPTYGSATDAALNQAQLQMTPDQAKQADTVFETFMDQHWNFYGR